MFSRGLGVGCAIVATAFAATLARGQNMSMSVYSPAQAYRAEFSRTEISILARLLNLGEPEREALNSLYDGYVGALASRSDAIGDDLQDRIERSQAIGDPGIAQPSAEETKQWEAEAERLKQTFLDDLKSMMTREQVDRWPLAEREMRRFKRIGAGRMYGESIDLVRVIEESFPEAWAKPEVTEVLNNYAVQMDGALKRRDAASTPEIREEFEKLAVSDKPAAESLYRSSVAARTAVRDLNTRTTEQLAGLMGEEAGMKLRRLVFDKSFPSLVRPSRSENFIRAVAALDTLSSEQATDVKQIVAQYDQRRWVLLNEMATVQRERQASRLPAQLDPKGSKATVATTADGEQIQFWSSANMKAAPDDPMTPLNERRFQLDRDTRKRLEPILNESQRAAARQPLAEHLFFFFDEGELGL